MSTARKFHALPASPVTASRGSWWTRVGSALRAVWNRAPATLISSKAASAPSACPPVATKIAAIAIAGKHTRHPRKALSRIVPALISKPAAARRPGVQSRWKTSDRVATL